VIGTQLALLCALRGFDTQLVGRSPESLKRAEIELGKRFKEYCDAGLRSEGISNWRKRLHLGRALDDAKNSDLVFEAIIEDIKAKNQLFCSLEGIVAEDTLLLSSTSGLPVDEIFSRLKHPERAAVAHFANPPHLMPTVELVPGTATSARTMERADVFLRTLGKIPVRLRKDIPGHIFNRIQFAMLREAIALVRDGVANPQEIDAIVKNGLALRLAEEGPLEKIDLAGLELVSKVAAYLFPDLDCSKSPDILAAMLSDGRTGAGSGSGFYEWTPERVEDVITRRNREVIRHLERLKTNEANDLARKAAQPRSPLHENL
jgi:3-hydroxybutyryl-CoA dehydrogenase